MGVHVYVHIHADTCGSQKMKSEYLELELGNHKSPSMGGCWEQRSGHQKGQQGFFTAEPPHQPQVMPTLSILLSCFTCESA